MNATPLSISLLAPGTAWWIYALVLAVLALHIGAGSVAMLSGTAAVTARKGERQHRRFGTVFVAAMTVMATAATGLAVFLDQRANIAAGGLAAYLVATAWTTIKRKDGETGLFEKFALAVVLAVSALFLSWGLMAQASPAHRLDGYAPVFYFVFAGIAAGLAALDLKVIVQGGVRGVQRIARHLWRMCLAFFFATGSFFLGQQKVMPVWMHGSPVLIALGVAPLLVMAYWLVRVRFRPWRAARLAVQA